MMFVMLILQKHAEAKLVEKATGQASMHTEPRYTLVLDSQSVAAWILK